MVRFDMRNEPIEQKGGVKRKGVYPVLKRLQDIVLSAVALIVLMPIMLVIALVIVIDTPGASPIFSQMRVGIGGKEFKLFKFRSMCPNAEAQIDKLMAQNEMDGPVFKIRNDPRITRVGRFLRKTSMDELPQLWNILRGDMSIVGPRPALPREVEQYDEEAKKRLAVLPGLTCYWQIQPKRNSLSFDKWLQLDLKYIEERSFLVDWKIMFATVHAVLNMEGE